MQIRFIDAGTVSGLRSQSIYHGLGYAQQPTTPDTIVLATPGTPYMCVGYFQDVEHELDMNYCRQNHLPVIRRETGGGAVYIDQGQLFVQWVFQQRSLPVRVDQRFQLFVKPLIETYKFFGINAYYHPINDVHVDGKKIVGTGAATIGNGEVVTGNFLFDFNYPAMVEAINVPGDDFRAAVRRNLRQYLTTMALELEELPARAEVITVYRQQCEQILGIKTVAGEFTREELRQMELIEEKFQRDDWLYQTKRPAAEDKLFKVHLGLWIGQCHRQVTGGTIKALVTMKDDRITELLLNGPEPAATLKDMADALLGAPMDKALIAQRLQPLLAAEKRPAWTEVIFRTKELQQQQTGHGTLARSN